MSLNVITTKSILTTTPICALTDSGQNENVRSPGVRDLVREQEDAKRQSTRLLPHGPQGAAGGYPVGPQLPVRHCWTGGTEQSSSRR